MDMERRMAPVLAAGKKADIRGLCERCDKIVGWFFLEPKVFKEMWIEDKVGKFESICKFEVEELDPSCKICKFLYSIRPGKDKRVVSSYVLARSTVGCMLRFRHTLDKSPIFYLTSDIMPIYSHEGFGLPRENTHDTVFGYSGVDAYDDGVAWGRLPATLPDLITGVIKVVISLGYRYLWIDRYCVPQTDSSGVKSLLLQNMGKIYSQSTLTIITATTKCPSEGHAGITRPRVVSQESLQLNSVHLVQLISNIQNEVEQSVWNTRGWTYQEALLSRRRLVFTETQCYFQCDAEGSQMESIDYGLRGYGFSEYGSGDYVLKEEGAREYPFWERGPGNYVLKKERKYKRNNRIPIIFSRRPKYSINDKLSEFQQQVNAYTQRQLSKDSDVLPAFLGILGMFKSEWPDFHGHISGVPIFELSGEYLNINTTSPLIMGITWRFDTKFETPEDVAQGGCTKKKPDLTQLDLVQGPLRRDMVHDMALGLEFESGTILSWSREADLADIVQNAMLMGNVHYLHVVGWITHLRIPVSLNNTKRWRICGQYEIDLVTMHWLLRLAEEQGMNVTDNGEYVFKVWICASVTEPSWISSNDVHMMLLGETSDSTTFERIDVCRIELESRLRDEEEWKRKSVMDIGKMLGWEWKAFRLA
ncbi:hypothetical protein BPOR_1629g00010 [Botrytis porri]|uniref:Heterokaryon incompatibility domain-containing protein n=1 Tax=Botrytis porri TaxID=87229 RepID=A0A4Z1KHC0_9HELO|nr:hypothetical protein BPOR_1629g00010 [Botrytis porri]